MLLKKIHRSRTNKYVIPVRLHKSARLNNFKPSGLICYYFFPSVFLSFSLFHSRLNFIDRISWLSVLCKNKFPQIKITAQILPAKTYSRGNTVCSNLNYTRIQYQEIVSVQFTTGLFFSEKYWLTLSIVWKYVFLLHVLNKNDNIINAGYWVLSEIAKINPQQEKPVCPNRKN